MCAMQVHNDVLDAAWDELALATHQVLCSDEPANFAAVAGLTLADQALTPGDGNGDFTIADGDNSGRKITVSQQTGVAITASGEADHIVYHDGVRVLYVTTCTPQTLTSGGTATVPAHDMEIADPVAA